MWKQGIAFGALGLTAAILSALAPMSMIFHFPEHYRNWPTVIMIVLHCVYSSLVVSRNGQAFHDREILSNKIERTEDSAKAMLVIISIVFGVTNLKGAPEELEFPPGGFQLILYGALFYIVCFTPFPPIKNTSSDCAIMRRIVWHWKIKSVFLGAGLLYLAEVVLNLQRFNP